jgi:hypothetical protein
VTIDTFFEALGAPLRNVRWSWGAVRPDGAIVLRVWKEQVQTRDGRAYAQIWKHGRTKPTDLGRRERFEHVTKIEHGAPCFLIMCEAVDMSAKPRQIRTFDEELVPGGTFKWIEGHGFIEMLPPVPAPDAFDIDSSASSSARRIAR